MGKSAQYFYESLLTNNSEDLKDKVSKAVIGIAGCGGLSSNAAAMLVRSGIVNLVIADYDKVEISNLNRQNYFLEDLGKYKVDALEKLLKRINPLLKIKKCKQIVTEKNAFRYFKDCKIVIEAFDSIEAKAMMIKLFSEKKYSEKFLIGASGVAGYGGSNKIKTRELTKNIFICGDNTTAPDKKTGLMAPNVILTAAHQANKALELIAVIKK